jgi:hypothetical protein
MASRRWSRAERLCRSVVHLAAADGAVAKRAPSEPRPVPRRPTPRRRPSPTAAAESAASAKYGARRAVAP